jgi:glucose/arabinose dehydrogenase
MKLRSWIFAGAVVVVMPLAALSAADWGGAAQAPVPGLTRAPAAKSDARFSVVTVASGLDHPWGLQFLPDGRMLVTERVGRLRLVTGKGRLSPPVAGVPDVLTNSGQAGLFDVALDPGFAQNHILYVAYFERRPRGQGLSVARAKLEDSAQPSLTGLKIIFRAQPETGPAINLGGRLVANKDGTLFVTVGDRFTERDKAQDLSADNGKIVRINSDGSIPNDNPFVSRKGARAEIWTLGHRNPEGLAIRPSDGSLWDVEHGAKGGDEINLIKPGHNYGWPVITYGVDYSGEKIGIGTSKPGMDQPVYYWDPSIAPSGMAFYTGNLFPQWKGNLFIGALKFKSVRRLVMRADKVVGEETLLGDLGERIRDIRQGPDGALYILTDNTNGRILKLIPKA